MKTPENQEKKVLEFHGPSPLPVDYPDRITQEEIVAEKLLSVAISEDRERLAEKTRLRAQLRERIVRKLKSGAAVEPGIHTVWIETRERLKTR